MFLNVNYFILNLILINKHLFKYKIRLLGILVELQMVAGVNSCGGGGVARTIWWLRVREENDDNKE